MSQIDPPCSKLFIIPANLAVIIVSLFLWTTGKGSWNTSASELSADIYVAGHRTVPSDSDSSIPADGDKQAANVRPNTLVAKLLQISDQLFCRPHSHWKTHNRILHGTNRLHQL